MMEKYMPKGSLIVGTDLDPIKPLPNCVFFQGDITTQQCRTTLRGIVKHMEADIVVHDGAPNVGTSWLYDAYTQNELVLQSMKLASEFLRKGGCFVTKVFRSSDYNSLMWVFNQLFGKVEATKPPSSRNVSAEIFVVCQDYLKPKSIDPKFLDPKHVFKELSAAVDGKQVISATTGPTAPGATQLITSTDIFAPEKKKRNRTGYAEGDYTLYREVPIAEFVHAQTALDAIAVLSSCNRLIFDDSEQSKQWLDSRHTTEDILEDVRDLKVLGKGDFKKLIKWRLAVRLETGLDVKKSKDESESESEADEEPDVEGEVTEEMTRLHKEALARAKRERRRANAKKTRTIQRLHLNMTAPEDLNIADGQDLEGEDMFDLGAGENEIKRKKRRAVALGDLVQDADGMDESEEDAPAAPPSDDESLLDSEDEREAKTAALEGALDDLYDAYRDRMNERDAKWKVKQARLADKNREAWHGIKEGGSDDEDDGVFKGVKAQGADADAESEESDGGWDVRASAKAKLGEDDSSDDSASDLSEDEEGKPKGKRVRVALPSARAVTSKAAKPAPRLVANLGADVQNAEMSRAAQVWFDQSVFRGVDELAELDAASESDEPMAADDSDDESAMSTSSFEIAPAEPEDDGTTWDVEDEDQDEVKQKKIRDRGLLTAEAVTLATQLVNRQKTASDLIDDGFNKHNFHSKDGLPAWFLDDESKHYKTNLPVTKEAIDALRAKQRALDARPIKKVAEAKARKKFKAHQRLEKAKRKAEGLLDAPDTSERDKAQQVVKVLGKAAGAPKRKEIKLVVARGANRGIKGRPKGVKGRYRIVDPRQRKELRAQKRKEKATKKRK